MNRRRRLRAARKTPEIAGTINGITNIGFGCAHIEPRSWRALRMMQAFYDMSFFQTGFLLADRVPVNGVPVNGVLADRDSTGYP
jgi:hypothetical protein